MEGQLFGNEGVLRQLPCSLRTLLNFERFHLHNVGMVRNAGSNHGFDVRYLPERCAAFDLPCFWVDRRHLFVFGEQTKAASELELFKSDESRERVLLPIHPVEVDCHKEFLRSVRATDAKSYGLRVWAVPTSSTRTLLAWPEHAPEKSVFIKTSLRSSLLGDRRLSRRLVGASVGISNLVEKSVPNLPPGLCYLFERVGLVPRLMPSMGVIIRSIPNEVKSGEAVVLAPLFSLLGGRAPYRALFLTMIEQNGINPRQFVEDVLCAKFAKLWLELTLKHGFILESHGQDLMLVLSKNLTPEGRFCYRDFEGVRVDWQLRRALGFAGPNRLPHDWSWHETYSMGAWRYGDLIWKKLEMSLRQYLHLVLNQLDVVFQQWQRDGLLRKAEFAENEVTSMFSRHIVLAIRNEFDAKFDANFNIYYDMNKFLVAFMKLRRSVIRGGLNH